MDSKTQEVMFSKKSDEWTTPKDFYTKLNKEFKFTFDPCPSNAKFDGLQVRWGKRSFINPPYSMIREFLLKMNQEFVMGRLQLAVFLVPSRTDTRWFHDFVYNRAELRFIKGRLKFGAGKNSAPFPSMIAIFKKRYR